MARLKIRQETFDEVVELLVPSMNTEADRRGLLFWAFGNNKTVLEHLNYGGQAREFVEYLVGYLCAYGEIEPGVQALWMLMVTVRNQANEVAQKRIDALFPVIQQNVEERVAKPRLIELYGEDTDTGGSRASRDAKNLFEIDQDEVAQTETTFEDARRQEKARERDKVARTETSGPGKIGAKQEDTKVSAGVPVPKPNIATEEVRFTAYFPKEIVVEKWYSLLVYSYVQNALDKVRADASKFKNELGSLPREAHSGTPAQLARGTELVIVPTCEGMVFNPDRISIRWLEDVHRAEVRFSARKELAGSAGNGIITISVGPVIIAAIKMALLIEEAGEIPQQTTTTQEATTTVYKQDQIFLSYSHTDTPIVVACRNAYKSLGFKPLIDIDELRSGENWNDELMRMIDRADIFQLFWSGRSSQSKYVQQEWEYALRKSAATKGQGFIRPEYWEKPLTPPPDALGHLHFAYMPLAKLDDTANRQS